MTVGDPNFILQMVTFKSHESFSSDEFFLSFLLSFYPAFFLPSFFPSFFHVPAIEIVWFSLLEKESLYMLSKNYELIAKRKQMDGIEHFLIA